MVAAAAIENEGEGKIEEWCNEGVKEDEVGGFMMKLKREEE